MLGTVESRSRSGSGARRGSTGDCWGGCWAPLNPSTLLRQALQNLTTKDFLQFLSFNGPLCKPLIPSSLKSDLNALITIYRCTLSETQAVRVLLLLFISPSQQALSCSIHHGEAPVGRYICPSSRKVLCLCQGHPGQVQECGCSRPVVLEPLHPIPKLQRASRLQPQAPRGLAPRHSIPPGYRVPCSQLSLHPQVLAAGSQQQKQSSWVMPLGRKKKRWGPGCPWAHSP